MPNRNTILAAFHAATTREAWLSAYGQMQVSAEFTDNEKDALAELTTCSFGLPWNHYVAEMLVLDPGEIDTINGRDRGLVYV